MEELNLVFEGLKFMVLGMGTVFLFLVILIFAINIQAKVIARYFPEVKKLVMPTPVIQKNTNAKIAAITAAVLHHRKLQSKAKNG